MKTSENTPETNSRPAVGIYEVTPPATMLVEFQDHYIIYVGLSLGMLCCCRGLVESLASCVWGVDDCVDASCCDVRQACGLQDACI